MKAHLLHRDQDVDLQRALPWNHEALTQDLALDVLFNAMARGDKFVYEVVRKVILWSLHNDPETIRYRQQILQDCLNHPAVIRELYSLVVETKEKEKKNRLFSLMNYPNWVLGQSVEVMEMFLEMLKKLRNVADSNGQGFSSEGWATLFATLRRELSDEYLDSAQHHLQQLKFRGGVLLSAGLGKGNKGMNYTLHILHEPPPRSWKWLKSRVMRSFDRPFRSEWATRVLGQPKSFLEFSIHPRDESGARALGELRDRGISLVATALAQSADHVRSFFSMLQTELAFYVGCLNLHEQLTQKGEPICIPAPAAAEERRLFLRGLYDVCLALSMEQRVVGNDADADRQNLVMITGANQGGKSTFLRSVGLAQLMMQSGMFVPADAFCSGVRDGLFTHYKREEDATMKSGKLDEELNRMSAIVEHITPHSMILFNESFAATNEREGSEISEQILSALLEKGVKIVFVTHLYELAHTFHENNDGRVLFLRAERRADGARTFRLAEGEPLETSFGEDLYNNIFRGGSTRETDDSTSPGKPGQIRCL